MPVVCSITACIMSFSFTESRVIKMSESIVH